MPTTNDISVSILIGQAYYKQLLDQDTTKRQVGNSPFNKKKLTCLKRLMRALQWDLDSSVNDSITTVIYDLLLDGFAGFNGNALAVDPSVIIPGKTITVINNGTTMNTDKLPFTNVNPVQLLNYNIVYKRIYGNNPILQIFVTGFTQDEQTPPTIAYQDDDFTKDILSITWDYPVPVSGYISITGSPSL